MVMEEEESCWVVRLLSCWGLEETGYLLLVIGEKEFSHAKEVAKRRFCNSIHTLRAFATCREPVERSSRETIFSLRSPVALDLLRITHYQLCS
jgi:hypothetical protein